MARSADLINPGPDPDLLSWTKLVAQGWTADEIRAQLRSGELVRIRRGRYVRRSSADGLDPGSRLSAAAAGATRAAEMAARERLMIFAAASRSPGLVVSHRSAALLHGLPVFSTGKLVVHLTRNAATGAHRSADRVVHAASLADDEIEFSHGYPVTVVARTLVDLARERSGRAAVAAADAAAHNRLVEPAAVAVALDRAKGRTGVGQARRLLRFADGRAESPGESAVRWAIAQIGLPAPDLQVDVRDRAGTFLGRADFAYSDLGVIIEFDGEVKYTELVPAGQTARDVVMAERRREKRMQEAGFIVIRIVWSDLRDLAALERRIREAMARGGRATRAGLVTGTTTLSPAMPLL